MFSAIVSRNYRSGSVNHWMNNLVELGKSTVNNFTLNAPLTSIGPSGISEHSCLLKLYDDPLQQHLSQMFQNSVDWYWLNTKKYLDVAYGAAGAWNFFELSRDSIYLRETLTQSATNYSAESRYFYYYTNEIPWYSRKKQDRSVFYTRSPYVCDSFVLRNGEYVFASPAPAGIFTSSLERKITYQYTNDTAAIKSFIDAVNPIIKDPLWFYITANAHSFTTFSVREEGNYTDLYNWMASRSTDSVFLMTGGRRVFKQAATTTNTVERDAKGRIKKITNKTENSLSYKTLELFYE